MSRDARPQNRLAMTMAEERPVDFGTFLRQAREHRGVSLQDLAESTKISARVLESLERNDPSKLPGGIFSRAFVRAYAREVGLDPDVAVASFVTAFPDESGADEMPATTRAVEVESFEQRRRVVRVLVRVLGVALLVAIVAFLYYSRFGPGAPAAKPAVSQAPEGAASSAPQALPTYQAPATPPAPGLQAPAPAAAEPAPRRRASLRAGGAARGPAGVRRRVLVFGERGRHAHAVADGGRRRANRVRRSSVDHADGRQRRRPLDDAQRPACPRPRRGRRGRDADDSRLRIREPPPLGFHGVAVPHAAP